MIGQGLGRVAQAEKLSIQQLEEALENRTIPAYIGIPLLEEKVQLEQRMKMAQAGMMARPQMTIADQVMDQAEQITGGIDQVPTEFAPEMAGGGIVAFDVGGNVNSLMSQMTEDEKALFQQTGQLPMWLQNLQGGIADPGIAPEIEETTVTDQVAPGVTAQSTQISERGFAPLDVNKVLQDTETLYGSLYKGSGAAAPQDRMSYVDQAEQFFAKAGVNLNLAAEQAAQIAAEKEALGKDREEAKNMRIMEAGFAIMAGTSPNAFENIGKGATKAMQGYVSDIKDLQKTERELAAASRKMMQAQNEIRMGVAGEASKNYQADVERYNAAKDKMAERKADLAAKLMQDDRARQVVEAQTRSSTYEQMRSDILSGDPRREEFARSYLGVSKTGTLNPALLEKEWNDMKITDKMKYRNMGIETAQQYAAYRLREVGRGGATSSAENDPLGLRNP